MSTFSSKARSSGTTPKTFDKLLGSVWKGNFRNLFTHPLRRLYVLHHLKIPTPHKTHLSSCTSSVFHSNVVQVKTVEFCLPSVVQISVLCFAHRLLRTRIPPFLGLQRCPLPNLVSTVPVVPSFSITENLQAVPKHLRKCRQNEMLPAVPKKATNC